MNTKIWNRVYPVIGILVLLMFPFLAIKAESIKGYVLLVIIWIIGILLFSRTCPCIRHSKKHNQIQWLFLLSFCTGMAFYIKAFKVADMVMHDEDIVMRVTTGLAAYILVFVIVSVVIMYIGRIIYKKQKLIK